MSQKNSENVSSLLNRDTGKAITEKAGRQKAESAAPAPAPKEANTEVKGIGVVKGGESGGRVLPKEDIDPEVLNFLKVS